MSKTPDEKDLIEIINSLEREIKDMRWIMSSEDYNPNGAGPPGTIALNTGLDIVGARIIFLS